MYILYLCCQRAMAVEHILGCAGLHVCVCAKVLCVCLCTIVCPHALVCMFCICVCFRCFASIVRARVPLCVFLRVGARARSGTMGLIPV